MTETIELERVVKTIEIDKNFPTEIEKLKNDGWELIAGIPAVAVYHLVRNKNRPPLSASAKAHLKIDESKVGIIRAGTTEVEWGKA